MAQTAALTYSESKTFDYTPGSAVVAGDVVLLGTIPCIAPVAIAASVKGALSKSGQWKVPQKAEIFTAGDAVYWDVDGTPVTGTALSGAATGTASAGNFMGIAVETTAATDTYVIVDLTGAKRTATIGGAVTASDIAAEDATLAIVGLEAAQGGLVSATGGLSTTSGNAGGAASLVGGVGGATGAGGAAVVTGGASGATSGTGGAATIAGGAAGSTAGNAIGGAASITGGIGKGTQAGGAASVVGGVGGATGAGGAASLTGGAGGSSSGTGGAVAVTGGAGTAGNANGGALSLNAGAPHSSGAAGAISIGTANADSITLGKMPRLPVSADVAVGGTAIGNANAVLEGFQIVTGADDTAAVILPVAVAGMQVFLKSTTAAKNLVVFPQVNSAIDALGANNAFNSAGDAPFLGFIAKTATQWYTMFQWPAA